jgi:hypothetical protein
MMTLLVVLRRYAPFNAFCCLNESFKGDTSKLYGTPSEESESPSNSGATSSFNSS